MTDKMIEYVEKRDKMMGRLHTIFNQITKITEYGDVCKIVGDFKNKISSIDAKVYLKKIDYSEGLKQLEELEKRICEELPEFYNNEIKYFV